MAVMFDLPVLDRKVELATDTNNEVVAGAGGLFPGSGSFQKIPPCRDIWVYVILGDIDAADTITFEPKTSDADNGALNSVAVNQLKTVTAANSRERIGWGIETSSLPEGQDYITLEVVRTVGAGTSAFFAEFSFSVSGVTPVEQDESIFPKANQFYVGGGETYQPA